MSAFIVSLEHVEVLATHQVMTFYRGDDIVGEIANTIKLLWRENHKSVNYRYQVNERLPRVVVGDFDYYRALYHNKHDAIELYKLVQCYDYQSCEHPTYEKSKAKAMISKMESRLASIIIGNLPAYDEAKWSI